MVAGALVIAVLLDRTATPAGPPATPATASSASTPMMTVQVFSDAGRPASNR